MEMSCSVLCVHGVGHGDVDPNLTESWANAVEQGLHRWNPDLEVSLDFLNYDDLFDHAPLNPLTYAKAFAEILASTVEHTIGTLFTRERALTRFPDVVRWTAGMVAQWVSEDDLRGRARDRLLGQLRAKPYQVICAHSLGSLISYDLLIRTASLPGSPVFVSLGSQIGNPAVRNVFAGRLQYPESASEWYHLFNPQDHVFTADIRLQDSRFREVITSFDIPLDPINHDPATYLSHPNTVASVWKDVSGTRVRQFIRSATTEFRNIARRKPTRRALLVGINDYPDPANRLDGCVNDVFLVSAALQESGFEAADIRLLLNERATADGLRQRLHWLLDDVENDDERVLFYSGHGAQIPTYGDRDEVDQLDECLVPYDFDWSPEHAILDNDFREMYSQLPYGSHFVAIFDCCYSGGMTREGGRKVRGLTPPDDIRHRALRWRPDLGTWEDRPLTPINTKLLRTEDSKKCQSYVGADGATKRLGRAASFRRLPVRQYDRVRTELGHEGPYLPVIMEACRENQLSHEYRDGALSYGAYTFSLIDTLRRERRRNRNPSFKRLTELVSQRLTELKFEQRPNLVGASTIVSKGVPWIRHAPRRRSPKRARR